MPSTRDSASAAGCTTSSPSKTGHGARPSGWSRTTTRSPKAPARPTTGLAARWWWRPPACWRRRATAQWTVMALLTDGEEDGLLGASAVVDDPEVRDRLKLVINVEAMGVDAPVRLFETGTRQRLAGRRVGERVAASARRVVRLRDLPSGCRTTPTSRCSSAPVFPGLNFAAVGDIYGYHTSIDVPERVTARALEHAGATVVAIATRLQRRRHHSPDRGAGHLLRSARRDGGRLEPRYRRRAARAGAGPGASCLGAPRRGVLALRRLAWRARPDRVDHASALLAVVAAPPSAASR